MALRPDRSLSDEFPGLEAWTFEVRDVRVERRSEALTDFLAERSAGCRERFELETLKDEPRLRAYRDFFWRVGIDPTKIRPAAEALLRRVIQGKPLPRINTLVDAYNVASMETRIALAAFDRAKLHGELRMRRARDGESFLGIGMESPIALKGSEIVLEDDRELAAVYPYRDADASKVTPETRDVLFLSCGVPGLTEQALRECAEKTVEYVTRFCGGTATAPR